MSGKFNPADYVSVQERIATFYETHPAGSIATELIGDLSGNVTFMATVRRDEGGPVSATGWATEDPEVGPVNRQGWAVENAETSAIGRALANLGLSGNRHRMSREDAERANLRTSRSEPPIGSEAWTVEARAVGNMLAEFPDPAVRRAALLDSYHVDDTRKLTHFQLVNAQATLEAELGEAK